MKRRGKTSKNGNTIDFISFDDFETAFNLFDEIATNSKYENPEFILQGFDLSTGRGLKKIYILATNHSRGGATLLDASDLNKADPVYSGIIYGGSEMFEMHFHPEAPESTPSSLSGAKYNENTGEIFYGGTYNEIGGDMDKYRDAEGKGITLKKNSFLYWFNKKKVLKYGHGGMQGIYDINYLRKLINVPLK